MPSLSRWLLCAEGVKSLIGTALAALDSPNAIAEAAVIIRDTPWQTDGLTVPGVMLVPMPELNIPATNVRDDEGHGVGVIIFQATDRATAVSDALHLWRDTAKTAIRNKRIGAANCHQIDIEPRAVIDPASFANQFSITSFVARCYVRTT